MVRPLSILALAAAILAALLALRPAPSDPEVERIQAHLAHVEAQLRQRTPPTLTPARREARAELLAWLGDYRRAGVFPHNHTHPGERVPVFVDGHGTPCAMAYLILRSGDRALVESVVGGDNNVRVPELKDAPRFRAWLDDHGLSLDEAAWIQPTYDGWDGTVPGEPAVSDYEGATIALAAATLGGIVWTATADAGHRAPAWLTLGLGVADAGMAAYGLAEDGEGWAVGLGTAAALGGVLVAWNHLRGGDSASEAPFQVAPLVTGRRMGLAGSWTPGW